MLPNSEVQWVRALSKCLQRVHMLLGVLQKAFLQKAFLQKNSQFKKKQINMI